MKRTILILAAILTAFIAKSQNVSGQWSGKFNLHGKEITVVFDIKKTRSGYKSTLYKADQKRNVLTANSVSVFDSVLNIRFRGAHIELFGSLTDDHTFLGALKQNNELFPLILNKANLDLSQCVAPKIKWPESVKQVCSYYSEELVLENKYDSTLIKGKLSMPLKKEASPAVVLICGNSLSNAENESTTNSKVEKAMDYLSSCGLVVFQYCSRENLTNSMLSNASANATDVQTIINSLKTRKEINVDKIKVIDKSNCGLLTQLVDASQGSNTLAQFPDLNKLFYENKLVLRDANQTLTEVSLYELGKWALEIN
jgi:uncharacterized protein